MTPEAQIQQRRHDATTEERARSQTSRFERAYRRRACVPSEAMRGKKNTCGCLEPFTNAGM